MLTLSTINVDVVLNNQQLSINVPQRHSLLGILLLTNRMQFTTVNPVLPCRDVTQAVTYYVEHLGFTLLGQDAQDNPRYAVIKRDAVELHLQWHDPATFDTAVDKLSLRFPITDLDALYAEYTDKDVFHAQTTLRETPWGTREFAFYDLNMNGLTFYKDKE